MIGIYPGPGYSMYTILYRFQMNASALKMPVIVLKLPPVLSSSLRPAQAAAAAPSRSTVTSLAGYPYLRQLERSKCTGSGSDLSESAFKLLVRYLGYDAVKTCHRDGPGPG